MFRSKINVIDFYKSGLITSFPICMCLLSRRGDISGIEFEINQLWNSFDDLTSDLILFVFGDTSSHSEERLKKFWRTSTVFEIPKLISVHSSAESYESFRDDIVTSFIRESRRPFYPSLGEWYEGHEVQTGELLEYFEIAESEIPCLHITFLYPGFVYVVPLERKYGKLFDIVKSIVISLHEVKFKKMIFNSFDLLTQINELESRIDRLKRQRYFHAVFSLKSFIKDAGGVDIHKNLLFIMANTDSSQESEIEMQKKIRDLKVTLPRSEYKKIKSSISAIYDSVFREPSIRINYQNHEEEIIQLENKLREVQEALRVKLINDEKKIITLLDKSTSPLIRKGKKKESTSILKSLFNYLELKPNFMGLGINLNAIINHKCEE